MLTPKRGDDELVAAEAAERVGRPQDPREARRDREQQVVADLVAERVVDRLEPVEVEVHHGERVRPVVRERCSTRSSSSTRLTAPVSVSCVARYASASSALRARAPPS